MIDLNTILNELTEDDGQPNPPAICYYPGGFKPPHEGHFEVVKDLASRTYITKVIVLIGHKTRDGITKESTDAVSGSDRLIWLCTSFTIFKAKSPEELAEDGPNAGNRKLVPIVSRHGAGLDDGDYINMVMQGSHAKLRELKTRNEFKNQPVGDTGMVNQEALDKLKNGLTEDKE